MEAMRSITRHWQALTAGGFILFGAACASLPARAQADVTATPPLVAADDALRRVVETSGRAYVGDCAATVSPRDLGKVCSKLIDQRGSLRAYLIGRTFSEFSTWVFIEPAGDGWTVVATTPLDFFDLSDTIPWPR